MILLKNVCRTYKCGTEDINALVDVNLKIDEGEFVFILGKSGSGKTTLLNIIGMLDSQTCGDYFFNECCVNDLSMRDRENLRKNSISFVFQHFELLNNYTVYENIELPLIPKHVKRARRVEIVKKTCKLLDIEDLLSKFPDELSGGQKQRVAIARAIVANNGILLADEPTGALDSATSNVLMDLFYDINSVGKTVIVVTHNEDLIRKGSRVIQILDGRIVDSYVK